jgi:hypothetical protein
MNKNKKPRGKFHSIKEEEEFDKGLKIFDGKHIDAKLCPNEDNNYSSYNPNCNTCKMWMKACVLMNRTKVEQN